MLKLYIRDNTNGNVHEYGTSPHDSLVLQEDGSLHYENLGNCTGSKYPEEGYSFCLADGVIPKWDDEEEQYIDIGGDYYTQPQTNADRIRAMSDEELAQELYRLDSSGSYCKNLQGCRDLLATPEGIPDEKCVGCMLEWLQQPAE